MQSRGLVVLDTPIGLVAVLPVGMAVVSSVVLTARLAVVGLGFVALPAKPYISHKLAHLGRYARATLRAL